MTTILATLVASSTDFEQYTTYVFELVENKDIEIFGSRYVMMIRWPNWDAPELNIGSKGYVKFREVRSGIDQWFDGIEHVYYKYDDIIFEKFIPYQEQTSELFI